MLVASLYNGNGLVEKERPLDLYYTKSLYAQRVGLEAIMQITLGRPAYWTSISYELSAAVFVDCFLSSVQV